ncbi:hypothetical protein [Leptolyngbya sp. 7M]|uniref:hypothetical protein n=1 Tax=Leptolyngbya sp. 7M TaxID=2812896 RepID=UPI001B8A9101|nr:hypothetical protein [Leptolyngbya sp. 7M]QYO63668.1 hypothetical protein JVX88_27955 [Leptolyngbya sp. 7M]
MVESFTCPYLSTTIELTEERYQHILENHPGTLPDYLTQLADTLLDPDLIRSSNRDPSALLFSKWFETIRTGRHLIVVVVNPLPLKRPWIVTVYTARRIAGGQVVWTKN